MRRREQFRSEERKRLPAPGLTPAGVVESDLPAAAIILRVIGQTESQEEMLVTSAALPMAVRFERGLVVGRRQVALQIDLLLQNSGVAKLPGCSQPAATLEGIKALASRGQGALSDAELLRIARQHALARSQLRVAFDALPGAAREEGAEIVQRLREADERAKSPYWSDGGRFAQGRPGQEAEMEENEAERMAREAELSRVIQASEEARRRLGQRTSASELRRGELEEALYGGRGRR